MAKRQPKSKEQVVKETKDKQEIAEMKSLAQASLIPVMVKHNLTAYQAANVIEVMKQVALGKMNQIWVEKPFEEIGLAEELASDNTAKDAGMYGEIIESFAGKPIAKVMKMLDVMGRVIDMYANKKILEVRVADLPLDEMMR